tara:strand:- start:126 stop:308 length:183 start_codon:yes stop_codon:yes gene_type:complete
LNAVIQDVQIQNLAPAAPAAPIPPPPPVPPPALDVGLAAHDAPEADEDALAVLIGNMNIV